MSAPSTDRLVHEYLSRLQDQLADLPRTQRDELVAEIREHVAQAEAEADTWDDAQVRTLLDRLGDPEDIAAEARDGVAVERPRPRTIDAVAMVLLLLGGVIVPVVGWLAGVVLLWMSPTWTTREKIVGTLVVPGGLLLPAWLGLTSVSVEQCSGSVGPGGAVFHQTCTGGRSSLETVLLTALLVVTVIAPVATTVFLARRAKRVRPA
jgi:uncharacterized membrane protein